MKNFVITISREFGANGSGVAKALAKELGIYYLDRDLVVETAERMGTDISYVGDSEEKSKNRLLHMTLPLGSGSISHEDEIFQVERSIIEDEASKQNIVVVGRCADYIFQDHPRHLNVFVYAPYEAKLKNIIELLHVPDHEAEKFMKTAVAARNAYRKRYCYGMVNDYSFRDMMVNSETMGVEGAAKAIAAVARVKFDLPAGSLGEYVVDADQ